MEQFPEIETERLFLAELNSSDIPQIVKYAANKNISANTLNLPFPYTDKDAVYWINLANQGFKTGSHLIFGIKLKPEKQFIGGIGLTIDKRFKRAEIGYWIAEPFWNKGFATEATKSVIRFGFEKLDLNKFTSSHFTRNPASGKVMLNCGMIKEGELAEHILKDAVFHSLVLYGLTKKDYEKIKEQYTLPE
jgi:RimJ/RimL family protein N-acetyltransferase